MLASYYDRASAPLSQKELNPILSSHERFVAYQGGQRAQLARSRLDGLNLANRTLAEVDFSGASLVGATFYRSNMERANLFCADLRYSDLQAVNLTRADMRGASFKGANLSFAMLDGADMRAARMMVMDAQGVTELRRDHGDDRDSASGLNDGVDFSNCSMKNASFGNAKLDNANFSGAILEGVKFKGAQLSNVQFKGAVLTGIDLNDLKVPPEALAGCVLDISEQAQARAGQLQARLASHENWIASENGAPAVLDREDLRPLQGFTAGRRLAGLSARGVIAIGQDFAGCRLQAAKFENADLRAANFSGCDLRGVSFRGANLAHARFTDARLGTIRLSDTRAILTALSGANLTADQLADANLDCTITELGLE
ncbi:MAG: pentapeptide repeat-containing protein [Alphaproteobacteria bacterium]|nr:pentapeptide repeat-containing protein [Alphaproteobacteria bacterium]MDE2351940.1 pentapeptide repeat-containing protein [Alphaproteobacteria bacterium]